MRLSGFEGVIVRSDAVYFREQGFITISEYQGVLEWLNGKEDAEIRQRVIGWMTSDARYLAECVGATARLLWYLWPLVYLGVWVMRRTLQRRVKRLAGMESCTHRRS